MNNIRNLAMASMVCAGSLAGMAQPAPAISADPVIEAHIQEWLKKMTLEEKIGQMCEITVDVVTDFPGSKDGFKLSEAMLDTVIGKYKVGSILNVPLSVAQKKEVWAAAIKQIQEKSMKEIGIPCIYGVDQIHGTTYTLDGTLFPQGVNKGATFNRSLVRRGAEISAYETKAGCIPWTYAPVVDLGRDPRWPRMWESYGEDSYVNAQMAVEAVKGFQGENPNRIDKYHVATSLKHFMGYGVPVSGKDRTPSSISEIDLREKHFAPFLECIRNGALTLMVNSGVNNGMPFHANKELLTGWLKEDLNWDGMIVTDWADINNLCTRDHIAATKKEAIKIAINAGIDMSMVPYEVSFCTWLKELVEEGEVSMSRIDDAVRRVLRLKYRLGLFENPYTDEKRADKILRCPEHLTTAEKIAEKSIVLLKNDGLLPIRKDLRSVAVIGPAADTVSYGDYTETRGRKGGVSVLDGIRAAVSPETEVLYERGCNFLGQALHPFDPSMLRDENGESGLTGHYYNGPVPQGEPVQVRTDRTVNFNWIFALPHPALDANCFSVAWTGSVVMPRTGSVIMPKTMDGCIGLSTQDSMRLYVDDKLLIDGWGKDKSADQALDFHFEAGRTYKIRIEFVNDRRGARVIFGYSAGRENFPAAVEAARKADVAILCMGDNEETSGENFDRTDLNVPGRQLELVQAVYATGTPVVLVLQSGRPVTANWENDHLPAILEAWFPGEQGGTAIAKTLFGDAAPGGRLPITFPRSVGQIPCHYSRRPGGGKRYVEMDWLPLYPFGYGLTYTTFAYRDMALSRSVIDPQDTVTVSVTVTNTGKYTGDAVPQLYVRDMFSSVVKPERQLAAFRRLTLAPGESRRVELTIGPKQLRTLGPDYVWRVEPGKFELQLGDNAENILLRADLTVE